MDSLSYLRTQLITVKTQVVGKQVLACSTDFKENVALIG